ncbi:MAG TPA: CusA/CzcA family heavy metal efflux RND transporter, partial [Pseudomonadota bacterium]|nr:CusA/CzcA family heavy metal efflux RND transporter [Pseudomonadota bacterium]
MSGSRTAGWVQAAVQRRQHILLFTGVLVIAAGVVGFRLKLDALPDVTNNQVLVLTRAPGLSPEEAERLVTRPIEAALGGMQQLNELRSVSRYGISAVTAVFDDAAPPLAARQITQERLSTVTLPPGVEAPALGPLTGGLGEVFHFSISSRQRTLAELLELATLRIAPRLRMVPGVVEVNTWGGAERRLEVRADPLRLAARGLTLDGLAERLRQSIGATAGASIPAGDGQALLRAVFRPQKPEDLGALLLSGVTAGAPSAATPRLLLGELATVVEGEAPRLGAATRDGQGETVYLMAQMLRGENALDVLRGLHERMTEVRATLPPDVEVQVIYDRSVLVLSTLRTVGKNLLEGGVLVALVLLLTLGSWRAGLLVAAVIPLSMLGATVAMVLAGIPGNLMSLGAVDFGLLVDGSVVMVEHLFQPPNAATAEAGEGPVRVVLHRAGEVAQPVLFSVLIILLVYLPVLLLGGVEGKMFRPMALTVVCALFTSLLLALFVVPAGAAQLLRTQDLVERRPPLLIRGLARVYRPALALAMSRPRTVGGLAIVLLGAGLGLGLRSGSEFVPQLDEGDLVIQTTRSADISLEGAVARAQNMESALRELPEVTAVVSRIGSPAVATDIMGLEQADVFVGLKPRSAWRADLSRDALIRQIEERLTARDPGSEPSFTQPIQMRFNEILAGAVTDVVVSVYGEDLAELDRLARAVAKSCTAEPGAEDVRVLAPPAVPLAEVRPRPIEAAQAGLTPSEILSAVQAVRSGLPVGTSYDGPVRLPIVLRLGEKLPEATGLPALPLPLPEGGVTRLGQVADVSFLAAPTLIQRHNGERRLMVGFNVRGVDLGTLLARAEQRVAREVKMPSGYRLVWGGQYETFAAARARLGILIPVVLLIIVVVLWRLFGSLRPTAILFSAVPFAGSGGMLALAARGMPISISAAIGFIALSGIAVLNGVVLMVRLLDLERQGLTPQQAAEEAARTRMRPVLVTALVAALGFVPMALAQGIGAEVQRPLATVVVGGLVTSTALTLLILPALYPLLSR